jgi:hypothetical protein
MPQVNAPLGIFTGLTRTPTAGRQDNYQSPIQNSQASLMAGQPMATYGFYEQTYMAGANLIAGPQEWIMVPDTGRIGVMLSFPIPGAAAIEFTCSPPCVIQGSVDPNDFDRILNKSQQALYPGWPKISAPIWMAWPAGAETTPGNFDGVVTENTFRILECISALRVNLMGGACTISIRCS